MLMDYATREPGKAPPNEDVRVAGLLDLAALMKYVGKQMSPNKLATTRSGMRSDPQQFYGEQGLFMDPRGRAMKDTGPTYQGRELPEYSSLRELVEKGKTLQDYLQGTEPGDIFGQDFSRVKVGATDLPSNYAAGYTAPSGFIDKSTGDYRLVQPGFLAINRNAPADDVGSLFEHEVQHAYQNALGMPKGTNLDDMSGPMVEYLTSIGQLRPAQLARIDAAAVSQGASKPYMRYSATTGEAEARAAEARYRSMAQGNALNAPTDAEYLWTHEGPTLSRNMLFDIPQDASESFKPWWADKWKKK